MLVLGRKRGETVVIGGGITVTVLDVRGDKVRLGFEAPKTTPINRSEVLPHGTARPTPRDVPPAELPAATPSKVIGPKAG